MVPPENYKIKINKTNWKIKKEKAADASYLTTSAIREKIDLSSPQGETSTH